jgi:hypothetical protein
MGCLDEQTVVAFVSGALGGPDLAAVERHLIGCETCAALVAVAAPDAAVTPRTRLATIPPRPGGLVGRYRLVRLVGRGGIGEVYAAHDPELDRKVAIKILRADANPDDTGAARLLREAQAVAKLSHPNVVTIFDVGTASGRVFLTMELVEGETLAAWLDRKRRSREEIVRVFILAGRGLAAAHKAGITHRDFKPQNVMVGRDHIPHVMDFGLAAVAAANAPRLTRVGSILGTPLYMAPEQLLGRPVDPRADQFAFCVALYEALYGERPFDGADLSELRDAVLSGRPRPARLGAGVPGALRAVLLRGLAKDRERRFRDMDALLAAIEGSAGRHRRLTAAVTTAAVAAAAVVAGGIVWQSRGGRSFAAAPCAGSPAKLAAAWPPSPDDPRRRDMRSAFLASGEPDAGDRFDRATQALDAYAAAWSSAYGRACDPGAAGHGADAPEAGPLRAACLDERARELGALADVFARADTRVVRNAIRAAIALPSIDACGDLAALKAAPAPPADPALRARVGQLHDRLVAVRAQAETGNDWQALQTVTALTGDARAAAWDPLLAEALLVDARIRSPFDPDAAVPLYEEAFRRSEAVRSDAFAAEAAIQLLAIIGSVQHRFDAAERWARVAETVLERGSAGGRMRGWFLNARGALSAAQGQWRRASADFAAAVASREQSLGPFHPDLALSLVNQAKASLALGDPDRAYEAANRALTIAAGVYPADAYDVTAARLARGQALIALDRAGEAHADFVLVRDGFERMLGHDHPFLAEPLTGLGEVALFERRAADARAELERAWELRSTHVADAGAREQTAFDLARAIWDAAPGDRRHALELAREARDGYAAIPDLEPRLAVVDHWLEARHAKPDVF